MADRFDEIIRGLLDERRASPVDVTSDLLADTVHDWVALTGPGLTEDVDETQLTTNTLWEAVTGTPGTQSWYEPIR